MLKVILLLSAIVIVVTFGKEIGGHCRHAATTSTATTATTGHSTDRDTTGHSTNRDTTASTKDEKDNTLYKKAPDEVDDPVVIDGDILVSKGEAEIFNNNGWEGLVKSQFWGFERCFPRWGKNIPYVIDKSIKGTVLENTKDSIEEINNRTCVNLHAKTSNDDPYILIINATLSFFGKPTTGARTVYLADHCAGSTDKSRVPAHEIFHALGRFHEQCRPDRDDYITINSWNTCPIEMQKIPPMFGTTYGIPYDYYSVMHYSPTLCMSEGRPSMSFKDSTVDPNSVGRRNELSKRDIEHIKNAYCPSMMVRLMDGEGPYEGRIEINSNDVWGTVCSNGFDEKDAEVICKYLGHPSVEKVYTTGNDNVKYMTKNTIPIWMSNLQCTGEEFSPFNCLQSKIGQHDCSHEHDVAVKCSKAARLIGDNEDSGRLEVYHNGQWGSVCNHKFDEQEAKVACSMMGYSQAVLLYTKEISDGQVVLSELHCTGTETHLSACQYGIDQSCSNGRPIYLKCQ